MLSPRLSVVEQIFACDEGVMGLHNDRRTCGKMPANGSHVVISFHYFTNINIFNYKRLVGFNKITFGSLILAAFRLAPQSCTSGTLLRHKTKTISS